MTIQPYAPEQAPEQDLEVAAVLSAYPGVGRPPAQRLVDLRRQFDRIRLKLEDCEPGDAARPIISQIMELHVSICRQESVLAHMVETRARERTPAIDEEPEPPEVTPFEWQLLKRLDRIDQTLAELQSPPKSVPDLRAEVDRLSHLANQLRDARLAVATGADMPDPDLEEKMRAVWDAKEKNQ